MPNRSLKLLIQERKIVHNIMTNIFPEAIKCMRRNKLVVTKRGITSPMDKVESQIVVLLIQMAHMHQPLNATEAFQLANDLVDGEEIEKEVIKWKRNMYTSKRKKTTFVEHLVLDTGKDL